MPKPKQITRRALLGQGAALAGAALTTPITAAAKAKDAKPTPLPNLDPPIVSLQSGKLRGFRDGKTTVFLGIPYAEAERFELPQPVKPWEGIKSAQAWGPVCPFPR